MAKLEAQDFVAARPISRRNLLIGMVAITVGTLGGLGLLRRLLGPPLSVPEGLRRWLEARTAPKDALDQMNLSRTERREVAEEVVSLWKDGQTHEEFDKVLLRKIDADLAGKRMLDVGGWQLTRTMAGLLVLGGLLKRGQLQT